MDITSINAWLQVITGRFSYTDVTWPILQAAVLDLDKTVLLLQFDSIVNASSLNPAEITFSNQADDSFYALTGGCVISVNGIVVKVLILDEDFVNLSDLQICQDYSSCFISFSEDMIRDYFSNPVLSVPIDAALLVCLHAFL